MAFDIKAYWISSILIQLTFSNAAIDHTQQNQDKTRTVLQFNTETGKALKTFDLPNTGSTILNGIFLKNDKQIWLNFSTETYKIPEERPYNYWVGYDENAKKALWRTDFNNPPTSTLLPFVADKMKIDR